MKLSSLWESPYSKTVVFVIFFLYLPIILVLLLMRADLYPNIPYARQILNFDKNNDKESKVQQMWPTAEPTPMIIQNSNSRDSVAIETPILASGHYKVISSPSEILVEDIDANRLLPYTKIQNAERTGEIHNTNLYITRLFYRSMGNEPPIGELWKYNAQGNGEKLLTNVGSNFIVSPDEMKVAFFDGMSRSIRIYDLSTMILQRESFLDEEEKFFPKYFPPGGSVVPSVKFLGWNNTSDTVWVAYDQNHMLLGGVIAIKPFTQIDTIKSFQVPALSGVEEDDIAIDTHYPHLVYSTYSDKDTSGPITLYAKNLQTDKTSVLATNKLHNYFRPVFVDIDTVSILDEVNTGRRRILISNE